MVNIGWGILILPLLYRELMFCPKCGTLAFEDPKGNITCLGSDQQGKKCGYTGPSTGEKITFTVRKQEFSRGGAIHPDWDEPTPRLTPTTKKECPNPKCRSREVKPTPGGVEFECKKCGRLIT